MNPRYVGSKTLEVINEIAVDLDGTLSLPTYPKIGIGKLLPGAKEGMDELRKTGYKIVIYTARPWGDKLAIKNWLEDHQIPFDEIVCGKLLYKRLIDDRAGFKDWNSDLKDILEEIGTV